MDYCDLDLGVRFSGRWLALDSSYEKGTLTTALVSRNYENQYAHLYKILCVNRFFLHFEKTYLYFMVFRLHVLLEKVGRGCPIL